ncbi:MAG TPA: 2-aminoethylphosphonate--pyruvate transaminase [Acetobacteraceae bacterium]|jgi:2-aminoethylphosphonate-pyruvate transaminase|nr:2-aminoethylphosphonate--pyruvate transaminase [Acetobacteraceae bacterium]
MLLLIPGPVTTRPEVRAAMAQDVAPWDNDTRAFYSALKARVLAIAGGREPEYAALPLQGCGHFATEAAIRSFVPAGGRLLVPLTGHYAERMVRLAREAGREVTEVPVSETEPVSPADLAAALAADPASSHVGLVYSETSSGVIHDVAALGAVVRAAGRRLLVDGVSAFGALPLEVSAQPELDAVWFSSNKCLEGLPGVTFTIVRADRLAGAAGGAGSWSFDLADTYANHLRASGVFRFTPPAQILSALAVALDLFDAEGGQPARLARYRANADTLCRSMRAIGLSPTLPADVQGPIIVNIDAPDDPAWALQGFVDRLKARGFLISNFANTAHPSFRVGCIGAVEPRDMCAFAAAVDSALDDMGVRSRAPLRHAA